MTDRELYRYEMNQEELATWNAVRRRILSDCKTLPCREEFEEWIVLQLKEKNWEHAVGYSNEVGYYFIEAGERSALVIHCQTLEEEEFRWFMLKRITKHIGQRLELKHRETEAKKWRYVTDDLSAGCPMIWKENRNWVYDTREDTRKYWFEYMLQSLNTIFGKERVEPMVAEYTDAMNLWFEEAHWRFDWARMEFVEN